MKRLTKIVPGLTLLALLFATPAAAEEIIMVCWHPDNEYTLKYVDRLLDFRKSTAVGPEDGQIGGLQEKRVVGCGRSMKLATGLSI